MTTPLSRLRLIGWIEGISFLVLLLVAMPLKYLADLPMAVTVVGGAHGVLWVLFLLSVLECLIRLPRSLMWGIIAGIASVVPLGTFWLDGRLKREQTESDRNLG
jgi:integral membrane protein